MSREISTIDIGRCFPVQGTVDGTIFSRWGDFSFCWRVDLPPWGTLLEKDYDYVISVLNGAIGLLPPGSIVHRMDVFSQRTYSARESGFILSDAFERKFDGMKYMHHDSYVFLTIPGRKKGPFRSFFRMKEYRSAILAAELFEQLVGGCGKIGLTPMLEEELMGVEGLDPGLIRSCLGFTFSGNDALNDIAMYPDNVRCGRKWVGCHSLSSLSFLPSEVSSCREDRERSSEASRVLRSFLYPLAESLPFDHVVHQYIRRVDELKVPADLEKKYLWMRTLGGELSYGDFSTKEVEEFLGEFRSKCPVPVRMHLSVLWGGARKDLPWMEEQVSRALSSVGITPCVNLSSVPREFWSGIPSCENNLTDEDFMALDLTAALCLGLWESPYRDMKGGVLRLCDPIRGIPVDFALQEAALSKGLILNSNAIVLASSVSTKSCFMNKYLSSCYEHGQGCMVLDTGDSHKFLCSLISERSDGRDGAYYSYEKGSGLFFNPFRNPSRFLEQDPDGNVTMDMEFLLSLIGFLWKGSGKDLSSFEEKIVGESLRNFLRQYIRKETETSPDRENPAIPDPIFQDYYSYLHEVFIPELEKKKQKGKFDSKGFLQSLSAFSVGGPYGYLLNGGDSVDIKDNRFVVFDLSSVRKDPVAYPVASLVIMDALSGKSRSEELFNVIVVEDTLSAFSGEGMLKYLLGLWRRTGDFRASAVVVIRSLSELFPGNKVAEEIAGTSDVKVVLSQGKYKFAFDTLASALGLDLVDKGLLLSMESSGEKREAFIHLGGKASFVAGVELSPEEQLLYSTFLIDKTRLRSKASKCGSIMECLKDTDLLPSMPKKPTNNLDQ